MVLIVLITTTTIVTIIRPTTEVIMVEVANLPTTEIRQIPNVHTTIATHRRQTEVTAVAATIAATAHIAVAVAAELATLALLRLVAPSQTKAKPPTPIAVRTAIARAEATIPATAVLTLVVAQKQPADLQVEHAQVVTCVDKKDK